jgi:Acetyltransferase (GNAT) family
MSQNLVRDPFTEAHWDEVQAFDCGSMPWELEVSDWLKRPIGTDSALTAIHNAENPCRVWLYRLEDGRLVGFGALGYSKWRWTKKKDPYVPLTVIIWCGIQKEFKGLPDGPKPDRYSHQIMDNLITEALDDAATHPILGLVVRPENIGAIKLYKEYEFIDDLDAYTDRETGVTYKKMALVLDGEALGRIREEAKKK